jgi:hypothetical protein
LLKQRLSFFAIARNLIKDRAVGFAAGEESCSPRGRAQILSGAKPVGDLIAFKPATGSVRLGATPIGHGTVVFFTGVRQERHKDKGRATKRARRDSKKRPQKGGGKLGGRLQE